MTGRTRRVHFRASRPFPEELHALLAQSSFVTSAGRPNLSEFSRQLDGIGYEALRRAARAQTAPSVRLMEEVARVLQVPADHFIEYRVIAAVARLDATTNQIADVLKRLRRLEGAQIASRRIDGAEPELSEDPDDADRLPPLPTKLFEQTRDLILGSLGDVA